MNKKNKNILPPKEFALRQGRFTLLALALIIFSVFVGTLGYEYFGDLSLVDSFYNACMILTGMGPVNPMTTTSAKIFASCYALFSGIVFLSTVAIFFSPIAHRLLHLLKVED